MKKLSGKIENALWRAKFALNRFAKEERGDTNFISIAIILVVVLVLAVVFIAFGGKLTEALKTKINELYDALGIEA